MVESDDEWMIACCQNFLLGKCSLDLVPLDHFFLVQYCGRSVSPGSAARWGHTLHGIESVRLLLSYQVDFAYVALANKLDLVKTSGSDFYVTNFYRVRTVGSPKRSGLPDLTRERQLAK